MTNPLIAERTDSTTGYSGIPLVESTIDTGQAIANGNWAAGVIGIAGTALDVAATVLDPFGAIFAAGVGWLIEHVEPLSEALDALPRDPDPIHPHAETAGREDDAAGVGGGGARPRAPGRPAAPAPAEAGGRGPRAGGGGGAPPTNKKSPPGFFLPRL